MCYHLAIKSGVCEPKTLYLCGFQDFTNYSHSIMQTYFMCFNYLKHPFFLYIILYIRNILSTKMVFSICFQHNVFILLSKWLSNRCELQNIKTSLFRLQLLCIVSLIFLIVNEQKTIYRYLHIRVLLFLCISFVNNIYCTTFIKSEINITIECHFIFF